jgi:hypothetical protein
MIKTKIGDIYIKDNNFYDPNYIKITDLNQELDFIQYKDLSKLSDYVIKGFAVAELTYNSTVNLIQKNNAKVIDINNEIDNFVIFQKENNKGSLYREGLDKNFVLCLDNISVSDSFKSYQACYVKDSLIIVNSNLNNIVYFTKISQNEFGVYQKVNFSFINGNYKVLSLNKFNNILYATLCDNITTYIYKIEDYVVSLVKTVSENIVFNEDKISNMKLSGMYNQLDNIFHLNNENYNLIYDIITNNYNLLTNPQPYFENYDMIAPDRILPDDGNVIEDYFYVKSKILFQNDATSFYVSQNIKNFLGTNYYTKLYNFADYQSDAILINYNSNSQFFIYKATDGKTKIYVLYNILFDSEATFSFLAEVNINIKKVSFTRYFDKIYLYAVNENDDVYKIDFNVVDFNEIKLQINGLFDNYPLNNNHSLFVKVK